MMIFIDQLLASAVAYEAMQRKTERQMAACFFQKNGYYKHKSK